MNDRRVLVVEDDRPLSELLCMVLADEGYETRAVSGGREALAIAHDWRPDLILLDLMMHDMDGWAFRADQQRSGLADVPVLILSAVTGAETHAGALAATVLPKPFELHELLEQVRQRLS